MRLTALLTVLGREPFGYPPAAVLGMTIGQVAAVLSDRDAAGKALAPAGGPERSEKAMFFDALRLRRLKDYQIKKLWAERQARFNLPE